MYGSWDMKHDRQNFFFHLGHFLPFYPPNSPKNQNQKKKKEMPGYIIILHMCTKNYVQMMYGSWDMVRDGRTDGRKKWHTEVGAPSKKLSYF